MRKHVVIMVSIFLAVTSAIIIPLSTQPRIQVVGTISPDDLDQVCKLAKKEIRSNVLPKWEWDDFRHLGYVWRSVKEYEAQRILWVEVKRDGSVEVFAGMSKDVIRSEGYAVDLQKQPDWQITGYGYWAISNAAPHDLHIPPTP